MRHSDATIGQIQLDELVEIIPGIYRNQDQKRSIWDVWLHANHHAAAIGEEVRKGITGRDLLTEIADFAMWLFTMVHKLVGQIGVQNSPNETPQETLIRIGRSYSDLLWSKYPRMCPVCYWRRTGGGGAREGSEGFQNSCDCLLYDVEKRDQTQKRKHVRALRTFSHNTRHRKPAGVDEWQAMFAGIFSANLRHLNLTEIAFHLLEEMGEVSDAMVRMYTYRRDIEPGEPSWRQIWLEEELADVSSWLFTLVGKLDVMRQTADAYDHWRFGETFVARESILLSRIIWRRYGAEQLQSFYCPHCKAQGLCNCEIVLIPPDRSIAYVVEKVAEVVGP